MVPGVIRLARSFGSRAHFHPHLHLVVTDGGFRRGVAGSEDLVARIAPRVNKICEVLRGVRGAAGLKHTFSKLPAGYEEILLRAQRAVTHR